MSGSLGLLARALCFFRAHTLFYVSITALPYFTLHLLLWVLLFSSPALKIAPGVSIRDHMHSLGDAQLALFLLTMLFWATVPYAIAGRGLCRVASRQIENLPASFGEVTVDMALFLPSALLLCLIVGFVSTLGVGLFFIPVLFISALFALVIPAGAIEKLGPFAALNRGLKLASRMYGKLLGLYFCFALTVAVAFVLQSVILSNLPHTLAARMPVVAVLTCIPIVPLAIFNICLTLAYYEVRDGASRPVTSAAVV